VRDATGRLLGAISIAHLADRGAPAMAAYRAAVCRMAADSQLEAA
jgi:hypothetical protein